MGDQFLSQISIFAFNFPPKGWALCNGQLLPINQNQGLFSLLGTTYGGDGRVNFALPDLRSRVAMHTSTTPPHTLGEHGGQEAVTLTTAQIPQHTHVVQSSAASGAETSPAGHFWAQDSGFNAVYSTVGGSSLHPNAISTVGGGQAHLNVAPLLTLNYCISLTGIFPSQL